MDFLLDIQVDFDFSLGILSRTRPWQDAEIMKSAVREKDSVPVEKNRKGLELRWASDKIEQYKSQADVQSQSETWRECVFSFSYSLMEDLLTVDSREYRNLLPMSLRWATYKVL